jgi:hypothetical protein
LSKQWTDAAQAAKVSQSQLPMNPAPPVTNTFERANVDLKSPAISLTDSILRFNLTQSLGICLEPEAHKS